MSRSATHKMNCISCTAKSPTLGLCLRTLGEERQADFDEIV